MSTMNRRNVLRRLALAAPFAICGAPAFAVSPPLSPLQDFPVGSIVISTSQRHLYFVRSASDIVTFPIAVGRMGRKWTGKTHISRKVLNPAWAPPPIIRRDNPNLPALIPPGPGNPLGVAVLVLGDGTYGIHGTNRDETIGTDASYGCFRMHNSDILSLFEQVDVGTVVYVQQ